jgi:hypothetical protein
MKEKARLPGKGVSVAVTVWSLLFAWFAAICCAQGKETPGRLFFSHEEKKALQALRWQGREPQENRPAGAEASPREIFLRGVLWAESGRHWLWLEGPTGFANGPAEAARLQLPLVTGKGVPVLLPGGSLQQGLRPGQVLNQTSGLVRELYEIGPGRGQEEERRDGFQVR